MGPLIVELRLLRLGDGRPRRLPVSMGRRSVVHDVDNEDRGTCRASSGKIDSDLDSSRDGIHDDRSRDVTLLDGDAMGVWKILGNCHVEPLKFFFHQYCDSDSFARIPAGT